MAKQHFSPPPEVLLHGWNGYLHIAVQWRHVSFEHYLYYFLSSTLLGRRIPPVLMFFYLGVAGGVNLLQQ